MSDVRHSSPGILFYIPVSRRPGHPPRSPVQSRRNLSGVPYRTPEQRSRGTFTTPGVRSVRIFHPLSSAVHVPSGGPGLRISPTTISMGEDRVHQTRNTVSMVIFCSVLHVSKCCVVGVLWGCVLRDLSQCTSTGVHATLEIRYC